MSIVEGLEINPELADHLFELPPPPELSRRHLERLTGRYRTGEEQLVIRLDGSRLTIELPDKEPETMTPVTAERFLFRDGRGAGSAMGNVQFDLAPEPDRLILILRDEEIVAQRQES